MMFYAALLVVLCLVSGTGLAQDSEGYTLSTSGVEIVWPPPVSEVWGSGDVLGTAAVPGMAYYYLEYLQLNDDLSQPVGAPWIPATVAIQSPVVDGKLATLDTRRVADGLYALRLVVNTMDGESYFHVVQPLRVNNARFDRILGSLIPPAPPEATPTPVPPVVQPPAAPRAVPATTTSVNVRRCDLVDNYRCAIVGYMDTNGGDIVGRASTGSGWFQVRLGSGLLGWVAPSVVLTSGDLSGVPFVAPPAPLPPLPPPANPNLVINGMEIVGAPVCNQPFTVNINVANTGNAPSAGGNITVQDVNYRTGDITFTGNTSYPALNPGSSFVAVLQVTTSVFYNETHVLRAYIATGQISRDYTLGQGSFNTQPTPTPIPPPAENPGRDFGPNQCFLVLTNPKAAFDVPYGNPRGTLDPAPYNALRVERALGSDWYRLATAVLGPVWIDGTGVEKQGNCTLFEPR
jgi:hypothetical protein